jgi:two-component sensor histidine kinase
VKNTLATVQSIAAQSFREVATAQDPGAAAYARAAFEARIFALARAHDVLTRENWEGAGLAEIVEGAVAPYRTTAGADPFLLLGSDLRIAPRVALSLSMALHELCTNAVKYGALSQGGGRVRIVWRTHAETDGEHLHLRWEERGGAAARRSGRRPAAASARDSWNGASRASWAAPSPSTTTRPASSAPSRFRSSERRRCPGAGRRLSSAS